MKKKVLVTGANGFLATNVISALEEAGYMVKGVLRRRNAYIGKTGPDIELVEGSFTDRKFMEAALDGCDFIVHCAAMTGQSGKEEDYERVNVTATRMLMELSIEKGIGKFVFVSSANAFAYGDLEHPGDETRPTRPPFTSSPYAMSKARAQRLMEEYKDRLDIVTVNPTFMIGPLDDKPGSGRIIMMGIGKRIVFCPPGGKNFVHVGDAAKGVVAAIERGKTGQAYLLAGDNLTYKEFYSQLCSVTGQKSFLCPVPGFILLTAGFFGNLIEKTGIKTEATLTNMKLLCIKNYYTNAKSVESLGIHYRSAETAIRDAVNWFKTAGKI